MILKNKLTKETLDIPYSEFRKKFAKEIQDAFNFYFELHWNFNHFGNSNWYIERFQLDIDAYDKI